MHLDASSRGYPGRGNGRIQLRSAGISGVASISHPPATPTSVSMAYRVRPLGGLKVDRITRPTPNTAHAPPERAETLGVLRYHVER